MRRRFGTSPDKFPLENLRIKKSAPAWPRPPIYTQERDQIVDPDVAVVTTIGIDHTAWLGDTRDWIAAEKAGIFRSHRPAVVGHRAPSGALLERSETLGCDLFVLRRDFDWEDEGPTWRWSGPESIRTGLPAPALRGIFQRDNAATVLMAVACLNPRLPVAIPHLGLGLRQTHLPGRFQIVPGAVPWLLDVAHNAQAVAMLAANLRAFDCPGRIHAVFGVLRDKDPKAIAEPLAGQVDAWYLGQSADPRGRPPPPSCGRGWRAWRRIGTCTPAGALPRRSGPRR